MPRITPKDYGNAWENAARREENEHTYWLIRNGENVYLTTTEFAVGGRLVPLRDEFTAMFRRRNSFHRMDRGEPEWVELRPGSHEWAEAEHAADRKQRHYMKVALVLQGLIDRTAVFHPLPVEGVSFLQPDSYEAGHVQIIADAELALGSGRKPFFEWLAELNAQLRPGMRIVGSFGGDRWRDVNEFSSDRNWHKHSRLSPPNASSPASYAIHTLTGRLGGYLSFQYERTDMKWEKYWEPDPERPGWGWERHREVPYERKATCRVEPSDRFIIPIDLVDVLTMRAYMSARLERHGYLAMFPLLKAAIKVKIAEAEAEAPFRQLLVGQLVAAGADASEAEVAIEELVDWWKLGNKHHRPLVDDREAEAKACRMIVAEWRRRSKPAKELTFDPMSLTAGLDDVLMIARKPDGGWVVACAENENNVFIAEHAFTATGKPGAVKRWTLTGARLARLSPVFQSERWASWNHYAKRNEFLSGPEVETLLPQVIELAERGYRGRVLSVWWVAGRFFGVRMAQTDFAFDADLPYSGDRKGGAGVELARFDFVRTSTGGVTAKRSYESFAAERLDSQGVRRERDDKVVLFENAEVAAELAGAVDRKAAADKGARAASAAGRTWAAGIEQAWKAAKVAEAYARFMEDYGGRADLWEDHSKSVKLPAMPKPRGPYLPGAHQTGWFEHVAALLVERGVNVDTLTVRQAVTLCASVCGVEVPEFDEAVLDLVPAAKG